MGFVGIMPLEIRAIHIRAIATGARTRKTDNLVLPSKNMNLQTAISIVSEIIAIA